MTRLVFVMEARCVLCEARSAAFYNVNVFGPSFNPRKVREKFVVDKVAVPLSQVSVPALVSTVSIIPPTLRTLHLTTTLIRRTNGRSPGTFDQSSAVSASWIKGQKVACLINCLNLNRWSEFVFGTANVTMVQGNLFVQFLHFSAIEFRALYPVLYCIAYCIVSCIVSCSVLYPVLRTAAVC
jgi:hypothetical protein